MLYQMCRYCKNWFNDKLPQYRGKIVIDNGSLVGFDGKLAQGQYFRIVGSVFNDGVFIYPATTLHNETFENGAVWAMAIPKDFVDLSEKVAAWVAEYGSATSATFSPYTSESLANVSSYSKGAAGSRNADGTPSANTWQGAFAVDLAPYRKP